MSRSLLGREVRLRGAGWTPGQILPLDFAFALDSMEGKRQLRASNSADVSLGHGFAQARPLLEGSSDVPTCRRCSLASTSGRNKCLAMRGFAVACLPREMGSFERFLAHACVAWCSVSALAHAEAPAVAPAPNRAQCLAAHERAQDARLAGQLLSTREALRECSASACPTLVSRDCVLWLSELAQQIPSVIFRATKDGEDVVQLQVHEGDQLLTESLTGSPLELDPGPHRFVAQLPGFPTQDATYVLQAGDKGRVVLFSFVSPPPAGPSPSSLATARPPAARSDHRPISTASYVLGAVTLSATVTGVLLGALALSKRSDARQACAPLCQDRDTRRVKQLALGADIALAAALLGVGVTVYSYVTRPSVPLTTGSTATTVTPLLRVVWSGSGMTASGSF